MVARINKRMSVTVSASNCVGNLENVLLDCRHAIDTELSNLGAPVAVSPPPSCKPYLPSRTLGKLELVKCVKDTYNCGLFEAKKAVEDFIAACKASPPTKDVGDF